MYNGIGAESHEFLRFLPCFHPCHPCHSLPRHPQAPHDGVQIRAATTGALQQAAQAQHSGHGPPVDEVATGCGLICSVKSLCNPFFLGCLELFFSSKSVAHHFPSGNVSLRVVTLRMSPSFGVLNSPIILRLTWDVLLAAATSPHAAAGRSLDLGGRPGTRRRPRPGVRHRP